MAEKKDAGKKEDEAAPAPPPKKSKTKLFIIVGLVALLAIGGGAYFFLGNNGQGKEVKQDVKPVFTPLDAFTVNLQSENDAQFAQIGMTLKLVNDDAVDAVKSNLPEIRNAILLLLSSKKASELLSPNGKLKLATDLVTAINDVLVPGSAQRNAPPPPKKAAPPEAAADGDNSDSANASADAATSDSPDAEPDAAAAPKLPVIAVLFTSFIIQ